MYYGRKKAIIIAIVVILLVIILAVGGCFIYITTDLFKPSQTLFFKYMGQALEDLRYVENTQLSEIGELKQEMPYELKGSFNCIYEDEQGNGSKNIFETLKVGVEAKVNKPEEQAYAKLRLMKDNQDIFSLEYANSNNIHALKSEEIVTGFLGIENENLKVLAQKMGISDTSKIPNNIQSIALNSVFSMTEEEKQHIQDTYLPVLEEQIAKEKFSKEKNLVMSREGVNYNTTAYRLTLNAEEVKQIAIALLQVLKQDSITLDRIATKAKALGLNENDISINQLTNEIQNQINTIQNANTNIEEGISIAVYVDQGNVITTEIIVRNQFKYTLYGETKENSSKRYLLIENLDIAKDYNRIEIQEQETRSNLESTYHILLNIDNKIGINMDIVNTGSASENSLKTTAEVTFSQEDKNITLQYEQDMNFVDEIQGMIQLNRSNCGILNDYTTEQLQPLVKAIAERTVQVVTEKIIVLTAQNIIQNQMQTTTQIRQSYEEAVEQIDGQIRQELNKQENSLADTTNRIS